MKLKTIRNWGIASLVGLIAWNSVSYKIDETEQAVITRLGDPVKIILGSKEHGKEDKERLEAVRDWNNSQERPVNDIESGAGLYFKWPLIDTVHKFPDVILEYDSAPTEIVTRDKKRLEIDTYARWQIFNPLLFMKTVVNENGGRERLADIIYSGVRENAGKVNLVEIVRSSNQAIQTTEQREFDKIEYGREKLMEDITELSNIKAADYGISIPDVRIKRADLPEQNAQSVFNRMKAERERIAKGYRSEGAEEATKITASADKDRTTILAGAYETAERIKGEGDAIALRTYADAYKQDPKFFELLRTLESYPETFNGENKPKVMIPIDSQFMKYLQGPLQK